MPVSNAPTAATGRLQTTTRYAATARLPNPRSHRITLRNAGLLGCNAELRPMVSASNTIATMSGGHALRQLISEIFMRHLLVRVSAGHGRRKRMCATLAVHGAARDTFWAPGHD